MKTDPEEELQVTTDPTFTRGNSPPFRWWGCRTMAPSGLVVEKDIPAGDRGTEGRHASAMPRYASRKLERPARLLGISKVEAIGDSERTGSSRRTISRGFCNCGLAHLHIRV